MKTIQKLFSVVLLSMAMLFWTQNVLGQVHPLIQSVQKISDGPLIHDAVYQVTLKSTNLPRYQTSWFYDRSWGGMRTKFGSSNSTTSPMVPNVAKYLNFFVVIRDTVNNVSLDSMVFNFTDTFNRSLTCASFNASLSKVSDGPISNDVTLGVHVTGASSVGGFSSVLHLNGNYNAASYNGLTQFYNKTSGSYRIIVEDTVTNCKDTAYLNVIDSVSNLCANFNVTLTKVSDGPNSNDVTLGVNITGGSGRNWFNIRKNGNFVG
ncbi:MAG: hypothetical protein MUE53_06470, partial [Chitinophagales bacterium]|nr:hypothetical protein [Chitinophagales bacterium]